MKKDPENTPNSDDKDYGFPFVKVEPFQNPLQNETFALSDEDKEKGSVPKETSESSVVPPAAIQHKSKEKPKKEKNRVPLLLSLVVLILVVLASMAYFLYYSPGQNGKTETAEVTEEKIETPQVEPQIEIENLPESVPDSLPAEVVETPPAVVPAPTTPTSSGGKLIVLNAKEDVSYYQLVVASLPNERIAREEAQVFLEKGKDIWLIFPSGDTKNYRLSVGKYSSFKAAAEALASAKADFNESTWILKY